MGKCFLWAGGRSGKVKYTCSKHQAVQKFARIMDGEVSVHWCIMDAKTGRRMRRRRRKKRVSHSIPKVDHSSF